MSPDIAPRPLGEGTLGTPDRHTGMAHVLPGRGSGSYLLGHLAEQQLGVAHLAVGLLQFHAQF